MSETRPSGAPVAAAPAVGLDELVATVWATAGGRLRWARERAELSVAQVAHMLEVDACVVADLEADRIALADLPLRALTRLSLAYQRAPAFLAHGQLRELTPELLAEVMTCRDTSDGVPLSSFRTRAAS